MEYYIDISKAIKPAWWVRGDATLIPCEDGKHDHDYDVVEKELPQELVDMMRDCALTFIGNHIVRQRGDWIEAAPVGFNKFDIFRVGAKLIERPGKPLTSKAQAV